MKNLKKLFLALFLAKMGGDRPKKREKKILDPNSVHTWPGEENSEQNSRKIKQIKKPLSVISFSQNGMRQAEKERKKISAPNSVRDQPEQENSKKNSKN